MGFVVVDSELRYRAVGSRARLLPRLPRLLVELCCSFRMVEFSVGASFVC